MYKRQVKYRRDSRKGTPAEAVTRAKQKTISKCALFYMMMKGHDNVPCRFDVVEISGTKGKESVRIIKNAFDYAE